MTVLVVGERYAQVIWSDVWVPIFPVFAVPLLLVLSSGSLFGQSLKGVTEETCLRGDCIVVGDSRTCNKIWQGALQAGFLTESLKAMAALRCDLLTEKEVYVGNWERGLRVGRGTH